MACRKACKQGRDDIKWRQIIQSLVPCKSFWCLWFSINTGVTTIFHNTWPATVLFFQNHGRVIMNVLSTSHIESGAYMYHQDWLNIQVNIPPPLPHHFSVYNKDRLIVSFYYVLAKFLVLSRMLTMFPDSPFFYPTTIYVSSSPSCSRNSNCLLSYSENGVQHHLDWATPKYEWNYWCLLCQHLWS